MARLALEAITSWATVESFYLQLYVALAGGAQADAAAVFLSIEGESARNAAISALVELKLAQHHIELYRAISALVKTHSKARNKLVHWTWGYSPELPDCLLLADPRAMLGMEGAVYAALDSGPKALASFFNENVFVYTRQDFLSIAQNNARLTSYGIQFKFLVTNHPANREDRVYHALCAEPEIQAILDRRASRAKSAREDTPPPTQ